MLNISLRHLAITVIALLLAACVTPTGSTSVQPTPTLYAQLGGQSGVAAIVDRMLEIILADPRIKDTFDGTPLPRLTRTLNEQFCVLGGGPCVYTGDPMKEVHQGLAITEGGFNALAEDLQSAMEALAVPSRVQNRLLARLAPLAREIISR